MERIALAAIRRRLFRRRLDGLEPKKEAAERAARAVPTIIAHRGLDEDGATSPTHLKTPLSFQWHRDARSSGSQIERSVTATSARHDLRAEATEWTLACACARCAGRDWIEAKLDILHQGDQASRMHADVPHLRRIVKKGR